MIETDRRKFLIGLFGAAAVAAAGPLPKVLEQLSEDDFKAAAYTAKNYANEIYGDNKGNYAFARIEWLTEPPYMKVGVPKGFRPLREESDRLGDEAIARILKEG